MQILIISSFLSLAVVKVNELLKLTVGGAAAVKILPPLLLLLLLLLLPPSSSFPSLQSVAPPMCLASASSVCTQSWDDTSPVPFAKTKQNMQQQKKELLKWCFFFFLFLFCWSALICCIPCHATCVPLFSVTRQPKGRRDAVWK